MSLPLLSTPFSIISVSPSLSLYISRFIYSELSVSPYTYLSLCMSPSAVLHSTFSFLPFTFLHPSIPLLSVHQLHSCHVTIILFLLLLSFFSFAPFLSSFPSLSSFVYAFLVDNPLFISLLTICFLFLSIFQSVFPR